MRYIAVLLIFLYTGCAGPSVPCRDIHARSLAHLRSLELREALALQTLWVDHCHKQ